MNETRNPQTPNDASRQASPVIQRIELAERQATQRLLSQDHWIVAERIANHYLALAATAQSLKRAVDFHRFNDKQIGELAGYLVKQIAQHHITSFGIDPAWSLFPLTHGPVSKRNKHQRGGGF